MDFDSLPLPDLRLMPGIVAWVACGLMGWIVGRSRSAPIGGAILGLLCGPMGVIVGFALDGRPRCPRCASRLPGYGIVCPACQAPLKWSGKTVHVARVDQPGFIGPPASAPPQGNVLHRAARLADDILSR